MDEKPFSFYYLFIQHIKTEKLLLSKLLWRCRRHERWKCSRISQNTASHHAFPEVDVRLI